MKEILGNIKAIIAELVGIIGGFFWAQSVGWDYEPLILLVISTLCFIVSISLLRAKNSTEISVITTSNEKLVNEKVINGVFSKETPRSIKEKIEHAPLFQKEDVAKNYIGLKIKWHLKLSIIHRMGDANVIVAMKPLDHIYPKIKFGIDISEHPFLKIAIEDNELIVTGEIIECDEYHITIKLEELLEV
jgi:hypothetical protein